eukprot:PhM_4_TR9506/c2_g2_i1/m.41862
MSRPGKASKCRVGDTAGARIGDNDSDDVYYFTIHNFPIADDDLDVTQQVVRTLRQFLSEIHNITVIRTWECKIVLIAVENAQLQNILLKVWNTQNKQQQEAAVTSELELALLRFHRMPFADKYAFFTRRLEPSLPQRGKQAMKLVDYMQCVNWTEKEEKEYGPLEEFLTFMAADLVTLKMDDTYSTTCWVIPVNK